jgi:hypothetical protein
MSRSIALGEFVGVDAEFLGKPDIVDECYTHFVQHFIDAVERLGRPVVRLDDRCADGLNEQVKRYISPREISCHQC